MIETPVRMAYWLVPAEPILSELTNVVLDLAEKFGGPKFQPHLTIYHGAYSDVDPVERILDSLADFGEIELNPKALVFGEKFTQTCMIEFEDRGVLREMCQVILKQIQTQEIHSTVSHLSLFYGTLTNWQRAEIRQSLSLPKLITFNVVKAIPNRARVSSPEDVEYWKAKSMRELKVL